MDPGTDTLRLFFCPLMAPGHIIPMVDMAKLLAARGVECTIVTTPANAALVRPAIDRSNSRIGVLLLPFPSVAAGLPDGCENVRSVPLGMEGNFLQAAGMLREPFYGLLKDHLPDAVITDTFLPWTGDVSRELGIPRLVFHGMSFFSLCASDSMHHHAPAGDLPDGAETFVIPGLPHRVEMHRTQLPGELRSRPELVEFLNVLREADAISYGVVVNSFYELEPEYAEHYRNVVGRKAWHVGPVSLCNKDAEDTAIRGGEASADSADCLGWLGTQSPDSVLYVCFGSMARFGCGQLREIAAALEASGYPFIWVARGTGAGEKADWLPEGFEERIHKGNRGIIFRGWAPQVAILNHEAVGGFMTHCGWNSSLEGIAAGLPMVTWPLFAEQFYNERLLVDVLGVGVGVGARQYATREEDRVLAKAEAIEAAVERVMGGGEAAADMRRRARALGEAARRAMGEDGSSYADMSRLIDGLKESRRSNGS